MSSLINDDDVRLKRSPRAGRFCRDFVLAEEDNVNHLVMQCSTFQNGHVGIIDNEKADTAAKAGLSKRVTNVPIPYGDFRKHINSLLKRKWQSQ